MGGCSRPGISSLYGGGIEWSATPLRLAGGGGGGVTSLSASFLGLGTRLSLQLFFQAQELLPRNHDRLSEHDWGRNIVSLQRRSDTAAFGTGACTYYT